MKHPSGYACSHSTGNVHLCNLSIHNRLTFSLKAHEGVVRGCSYVPGGSHILTCADDKTIKLWDAAKWNDVPVDTIVSKHMVSLASFTNEMLLLTDIFASIVDVR